MIFYVVILKVQYIIWLQVLVLLLCVNYNSGGVGVKIIDKVGISTHCTQWF